MAWDVTIGFHKNRHISFNTVNKAKTSAAWNSTSFVFTSFLLTFLYRLFNCSSSFLHLILFSHYFFFSLLLFPSLSFSSVCVTTHNKQNETWCTFFVTHTPETLWGHIFLYLYNTTPGGPISTVCFVRGYVPQVSSSLHTTDPQTVSGSYTGSRTTDKSHVLIPIGLEKQWRW